MPGPGDLRTCTACSSMPRTGLAAIRDIVAIGIILDAVA
jgi:hypothetical protein